MRTALALFVLILAGNADACRCAERGLAEYFADADAVVIGRLNAAEDSRRDVQLTFELLAPAYKGPSHLGPGDEFAVLTSASSAACGVGAEPGAGLPLRDLRAGSNPRGEYPAEVHEVKTVGGMPFLRVTVWKDDPCSGGEGVPAMSGWVPAFGRDGRPTAWFWSRGC